MKTKILTLTILILVVVSISFVFAFGVSSPYWEGNPLQLHPGQTSIVKITYQNLKATQDLNIKAEITKGNEIATIETFDYLVRAETKDTTVPVKISIPENVPIGASYQVTLTSRTVTPGANGGVAFGLGMDTTFDVEVIPVEPEPVQPIEEPALQEKKPVRTSTWIIAVIGILVILVLVYILFNKNKTNKNKKR